MSDSPPRKRRREEELPSLPPKTSSIAGKVPRLQKYVLINTWEYDYFAGRRSISPYYIDEIFTNPQAIASLYTMIGAHDSENLNDFERNNCPVDVTYVPPDIICIPARWDWLYTQMYINLCFYGLIKIEYKLPKPRRPEDKENGRKVDRRILTEKLMGLFESYLISEKAYVPKLFFKPNDPLTIRTDEEGFDMWKHRISGKKLPRHYSVIETLHIDDCA